MQRSTIQVNHPRPHDIVADQFRVAGHGTGFEGTVVLELYAGGEKVFSDSRQAGGMGTLGEFVFTIDLTELDLPDDAVELTVLVFGANPGLPDEGQAPGFDPQPVPLLRGTALVAGYWGYQLHEVAQGDTLASVAESAALGDTTPEAVAAANRDRIIDPRRLWPGTALRIPVGSA